MAEAGEDAPLLPRDTEESSQRSLSQTSSMAMGEPLMQLESFDGHGSSVIEFCRKHDLEAYITTFQKASTLLQADVVLEELSTITTQELQALRAESEQKWNQPRTLYFAIVMCSLGAVEQGTAQTSMNGANLYFPAQFGIGSNSPRDTMIVGLINSGIYLSVAIIGAWLATPLNDLLGRRRSILLGSSICIIANIASAVSQNWQSLLAFRFLLGAGLGINVSTINVFTAECCPAYIRGGLAVSWQMFTAFGVLLGFVANVAVYNFQSPWRMQLAFPFVPALPLALLIMLCPESPAWLVKSSRDYRGAFRSLNRLRNIELQAAKELYAMHLQASNIIPSEQRAGFSLKLVELLKIPRIRRATLAAFVVMLSQQLCGINIISFYSSTIFSDAGFTTFHALLASTVFGFINFIGAFPAIWTMDRLGRRSLLLLTLPFMALTMLATSLTFSLPETSPARFGLLAATIYLFCAEYSPGMGPVPNPYAAEVFPLSHREIGMSFAVSVANVWASVLSLTFPSILTLLRPQGAFTLYGCLNVLAFVLVFLFVPETRMKTLDELDDVFSVPTRVFVRQHTMACMPRWIRRHVLLLNEDQSKTPGHAGTYSAVNQDEGLE